MKKQHWKWLGVSIVFSVIVLVAVLYLTFDETTIVYLAQMDPFYLVLALLLHVAALVIWTVKIQTMVKSLGYRVGFLYTLNMVNANLLVAAITPSQAGGEPVRIHELYSANIKLGDATAIVITERILDVVILVVGGVLAVFMLGTINIPQQFTLIIYGAWACMVFFVLLFLYSGKNPAMLKRLIKAASCLFTKAWDSQKVNALSQRIDCEVDSFHGSLSLFVSQGKAGLYWGTFFTAVFWAIEFLIPSLILLGLGSPPYFLESFVVQIIIAIIMMVPLTPGGSGIAEVSAYSLYMLFVPSAIVGVFVVLWRVIFYYFNIAVGILSSIPILRRTMTSESR